MRRLDIATILLPSLMLGAGCVPRNDAEVAPDASALCAEATEHSDLPWVQENVFTRSCTFSSCHAGTSPAGDLNLEDGQSEDELVNVASILFPDRVLVDPGDPNNSYLMVILGSVEGPLDEQVGTMPLASGLLCQEKRDAISRWIEGLTP